MHLGRISRSSETLNSRVTLEKLSRSARRANPICRPALVTSASSAARRRRQAGAAGEVNLLLLVSFARPPEHASPPPNPTLTTLQTQS